MAFNKRPFQLAGTGPSFLYEATSTLLGGGLIRVDGQCGLPDHPDDMAKFSFVYVPEMGDVIVYSTYRLEYSADRAECCANIAFSNPYYFEDIGEMCDMAPCIRTPVGSATIFLRPLIKAILGENILHQLTLPIERYAYYHR